jgi:diaminopimelate decarboxylase
MHHFNYRDGQMACEGVALSAIAEAVGTPAYVITTYSKPPWRRARRSSPMR